MGAILIFVLFDIVVLLLEKYPKKIISETKSMLKNVCSNIIHKSKNKTGNSLKKINDNILN